MSDNNQRFRARHNSKLVEYSDIADTFDSKEEHGESGDLPDSNRNFSESADSVNH